MGEGADITKRERTERTSERLSASRAKVDINSRSFKSAVTRAARYTDENDHTLASATMARAFGYKDMEKRYRDIERQHLRAGNLTPELSEQRRNADSEMEKRIKRDYGDKGISAWNKAK